MTEWRAIPGYEGRYEASDDGQVRSLSRTIVQRRGHAGRPFERQWRGRILRLTRTSAGYLCVFLGPGRPWGVHTLVAGAFLGPRPPGMEVCHNDGNKANNHISNLRYGSGKENAADSILHGTRPRGERNGAARLTEEDVRYLRQNISRLSVKALAAELNVHPGTVRLAVAGKTWAHVQSEAA